MLSIGMTKLQLDDAVGGEEAALDGEANSDDKTAKEMRKSLLTTLRHKFEADGGDKAKLEEVKEEEESKEPGAAETGTGRTPKKARGSIAVKDEMSEA
jgi:SWI/SNF-related matrix-associated actin-dependent regulator 1 of chromatin subfamily A